MKYLNKGNVNRLVTLLFFAALALYFKNNTGALKELFSLAWWVVLLLVTLKTARVFITGLYTKFILQAFGKRMLITEANYLSILSSLGNFFGPILGGASIRALYLKKTYDFEYSKFISTLYGFFIVSFMMNALIGLVLLVHVYSKDGYVEGMGLVILGFLVIFLSNLLLMIMPPSWLKHMTRKLNFLPNRLIKIIVLMSESWEVMRSNKKLLLKLATLNLIAFSIVVAETLFLYRQLAGETMFESIVLYAIIGTVSTLVSFTPGAIGIKEGIFLFSSSIIALEAQEIIQIATVDRSATFLLLLMTFIFIKVTSLDRHLTGVNNN